MNIDLINPMAMTKRRILVTGASSGIGREVSILLSRLGAKLVIVGRNKDRLDETFRSLAGEGHYSEIMDLGETRSIPTWLKTISGLCGRLDGLVHCAGMQYTRPLRFLKEDDVTKLLKINLEASIALAKGFRQKSVRSEHAGIVFVSSIIGLVGQSGVAAYSASKGALISLVKSLALELAQERIRVNCVAPGVVSTEMTTRFKAELTEAQFDAIEKMHPLGIGEALDVSYAIAFLLADTARWITGSTLVVDGGYTAH
jgi:NAD(P)-dependent dehydrogenase (short-subunit alcohol dehydrogenase family)